LVLFLIPVTFIIHPFWKIQDPAAKMGEMINFTKNLALLGAVLILLAYTFA
jgi:putative oxidoreductase